MRGRSSRGSGISAMPLFTQMAYSATETIPMPLDRRKLVSDLARASTGGLVSVQKAAEVFGVSSHDAALRLGRLARAGWLARAQRGIYLVLPIESSAGVAPVAEDAWLLANELFAPCYIGGWSAAEHWGLTEQLFRSTFVVTAAPRRKTEETRLSTEFHVARVTSSRLEGTTLVWRGQARVAVSDRERTIADALVHPRWVGGVRHLAEIMISYRASREFDANKLLARLDDVGVGAGYKRLGYLAELLWPEPEVIVEHALARRSAGTIRLEPSIKERGRMSKRWGLWVNVSIAPEVSG
jgi:predicted transcriptional regulator of viral defense system